MTFDVTNWNISPNIDWYVRLEDEGSSISVKLFIALSSAQHNDDMRAYAYGVPYGTDVPVTLNIVVPQGENTLTPVIGYYQDEYVWHMMISGQQGDPGRVIEIAQFTDLDAISHSIYRNLALITLRATDEINKHTHARIERRLPLATHIPDIKMGSVIRVNSARRNLDELNQIVGHVITGTSAQNEVSLTSSLTVVKFQEMTK